MRIHDRPTALFDSIHGTEPLGGGQRRTLQVVKLAQRAGFDVAHVSLLNLPGFRNRVYNGLAAAFRCRLPVRPSLEVLRELGIAVLAYRHQLQEAHDPRLILWETTRDAGMVVPMVASRYQASRLLRSRRISVSRSRVRLIAWSAVTRSQKHSRLR